MVGVVYFVAIRATITKTLAPYVRIIKDFDVCGTIHYSPIYGILESVLGAKGAEVYVFVDDLTQSPCPGQS